MDVTWGRSESLNRGHTWWLDVVWLGPLWRRGPVHPAGCTAVQGTWEALGSHELVLSIWSGDCARRAVTAPTRRCAGQGVLCSEQQGAGNSAGRTQHLKTLPPSLAHVQIECWMSPRRASCLCFPGSAFECLWEASPWPLPSSPGSCALSFPCAVSTSPLFVGTLVILDSGTPFSVWCSHYVSDDSVPKWGHVLRYS